jgi:hypothetical protein
MPEMCTKCNLQYEDLNVLTRVANGSKIRFVTAD